MFASISSAQDNLFISRLIIVLTLVLIAIIPLPVVNKGIVPIAIAAIGLPLLYAGTVIPITVSSSSSIISVNYNEILFIAGGYFLLGMSMMAFSILSAYKPSILYVRNRPKDTGDMNLEEYPVWDKMDRGNHVVSIGRFDDEIDIPLKNLMSEVETYMLWRYSYVLVTIHGIRYMAIPNSYVPYSSIIMRDRKGRMIGKSRFDSYLV